MLVANSRIGLVQTMWSIVLQHKLQHSICTYNTISYMRMMIVSFWAIQVVDLVFGSDPWPAVSLVLTLMIFYLAPHPRYDLDDLKKL